MSKLVKIILTIFLTYNIAFAQQVVQPAASIPQNIVVQNLSNRKYFHTTLNSINSAKKSIHLSMYFIALSNTKGNSKVLRLVNALINAHKRGVKVKVILDRTYTFTSKNAQSDPRRNDTRNQVAYEYLKENGIEVYYDDIKNYTHSKCLIIDEEIVIIGSTNWTTSALTKNNEASILIQDSSLAEALIRDFNTIELDLKKEEQKDETPKVAFSVKLMPNFQKFIKKHDEKLFAIFMYILKKSNFEFGVEKKLEYQEIKDLFFKDSTAKESRKNFYVRRYLKRLESKYNLIKYINPKETQKPIKIILLNGSADEATFKISQNFWLYDWHKRLDAKAIFCYFINALESGGEYKTWSMSIDTIHKKYKIDRKLLSQGMHDLRYWNLLQIQYGRVENAKYADRTPSVYRLLPAYDIADFEQEIAKLEAKYSKEQVMRARKYASLIFCDYDIYEIENIIQLELDHGQEKVKETFRMVGRKRKTNSQRSMRFVVGCLEG